MQRSQPNLRSEASPRMCALECQKTFLPSGSSNGSSSSLQLFSSGRSRSQSISSGVPLSSRAMTVFSNRLLLMLRAISAGLVSHDFPAMVLPSWSVTVISSGDCVSEGHPRVCRREHTAGLLGNLLVVLCLEFLARDLLAQGPEEHLAKLTISGLGGRCMQAQARA
jgi:hypothetical protein